MPLLPDANSKERELLARLRRGDPTAAAVLVSRLEPLISRMVFRLTGWHTETQDLVQEVFLAIQQSAESFRGNSSLETWVTAITIHQCRRWRRRIGKWHVEPCQVNPEPIDNAYHQQQSSRELCEEVQLALQALNQELREVIVLRYLEDHSLEEISQLLSIRKNTVEVRLHRARKRLGSALAHHATASQERQ